MKKVLKQKDGAALLIAIVIMVVLTTLGLALLLVSYSLHSTVTRRGVQEQCKVLAQSLNEEIASEISDVTEIENIMSSAEFWPQRTTLKNKYPLWFYLREHLWQDDWPYLSNDFGHLSGDAKREFAASQEDLGLDAKLKVIMWWESDTIESGKKDDTRLYVQTVCDLGGEKSIVTSTYYLKVTPYNEVTPDAPGTMENQTMNIDGVCINPYEKWVWGPRNIGID